MTIQSINTGLCTGCGVCVDICPLDNLRLDTFQEEVSPCRDACPANVDMRSCLYLMKQHRIDDAVRLFMQEQPFPAITGRVCPHQCESACARKEVDQAININCVERFLGDYSLTMDNDHFPLLHASKVAIIGSGPSGLSAAYFLRKSGYRVTIFEAMPEPGGMLRTGIPEYRLPKNILDAQIKYLKGMGIEIRTGITIGKDLDLPELRERGYKAFFFAIGAQLSSRISIEDSDLIDVLSGLDFLRDVNLKNDIPIKERTVVLGGGNVAIDAALSAIRLGAKEVELVCLESQDEMPAHEEGVTQAMDEGVMITTGYGPKKISDKRGSVKNIELVHCTSVFNKDGEFDPVFDDTSTVLRETDMIIFAIGQAVDLSFLPELKNITDRGTISVDSHTFETSMKGIFAGGDAVSGSASVVEAINNGKKAALSIDCFLKGEEIENGNDPEVKVVEKPPKKGMSEKIRNATPFLPIDLRRLNFKEVKTGFSEETAMNEAFRCMTCGSKANIPYDDCMTCFQCELECPSDAVDVHPFKEELPLAIKYPDGDK